MSIVGGLLRSAGMGTLSDALESQGLLKAGGMFDSRVVPTTTPEMFIGGTGVRNLGDTGAFNADEVLSTMKAAERDRLRLSETEWNDKYGPMAMAFDDPANRAMLEISDRNVTFKKGININNLANQDYYGFDEVFNAETLKKAYPELSDVKILMKDDSNNTGLAAFDPENNVIQFNRKSPAWNTSDPLGTALHEIQHYVQQRETLTQGESFKGVLKENQLFSDTFNTLEQKINQSSPAIIKFLKQNPRSGFDVDTLIDATQYLKKPNGLTVEKALEQGFKSKDLAAKFMKLVGTKDKDGKLQFQDLNDIVFLKDINSAAYNTAAGDYMRVAGETFARQTDQRRLLSPEERIANPAMKAIDEDRVNKMYNINTQTLTPSRNPSAGPVAFTDPMQASQQFADPFAPQIPQSTIQGI
jgi:hypothetical protein